MIDDWLVQLTLCEVIVMFSQAVRVLLDLLFTDSFEQNKWKLTHLKVVSENL